MQGRAYGECVVITVFGDVLSMAVQSQVTE